MPQDHMDLEHPTVAVEPVVTEEQVTRDLAALETDRQDRQVKCKYCDRYFRNVAECNMHCKQKAQEGQVSPVQKAFCKAGRLWQSC